MLLKPMCSVDKKYALFVGLGGGSDGQMAYSIAMNWKEAVKIVLQCTLRTNGSTSPVAAIVHTMRIGYDN